MGNKRKFGPNQIKSSPLCFGAMQFGEAASKRDSQEMYEVCRNNNINMFDTAYAYTNGNSETILGELIKQDRDDIILITKGCDNGSSKKNIRTQLETSLSRLDQDYVDIFFLHQWDNNVPLEEIFETLQQLKDEGKFFHLGVSNFSAWQVMKAQSVAKINGYPSIDILQPMYNLVKRQAEVEILPMALAEDIAVISYNPLGGGLLTGKYANPNTIGRLTTNNGYKSRYGKTWMHKTASLLVEVASDLGYDPIELAVAWVAHHDAITAPIISARNASQLSPSINAQHICLDNETYDLVSSLSITPPNALDK